MKRGKNVLLMDGPSRYEPDGGYGGDDYDDEDALEAMASRKPSNAKGIARLPSRRDSSKYDFVKVFFSTFSFPKPLWCVLLIQCH